MDVRMILTKILIQFIRRVSSVLEWLRLEYDGGGGGAL